MQWIGAGCTPPAVRAFILADAGRGRLRKAPIGHRRETDPSCVRMYGALIPALPPRGDSGTVSAVHS